MFLLFAQHPVRRFSRGSSGLDWILRLMDSVCLLFRELSTCVTYSFSGDVILSPRFSLWDHTAGSIGHTVCCKCCRGDERESSFSTPLYLLSFRLTRGTEEYTGVLELLLSKTRPPVSKTPHLGSHPFRTNLGEARGQSQERSHSVSDEELGRGVQFRGQLLGSGGNVTWGAKNNEEDGSCTLSAYSWSTS